MTAASFGVGAEKAARLGCLDPDGRRAPEGGGERT